MMRWLLTKGAWSEQPKFRRWKSIYKTTATYYYELPTSCPGPAEVKGNFVRRQCSCLFSKMLSSTHKSNNDAVKLNFEAHLPLLLFQVHTGISLVSTADISNFHTCVIFTLFLKFLSRIEKRPLMRWPTVYYKSSIANFSRSVDTCAFVQISGDMFIEVDHYNPLDGYCQANATCDRILGNMPDAPSAALR